MKMTIIFLLKISKNVIEIEPEAILGIIGLIFS